MLYFSRCSTYRQLNFYSSRVSTTILYNQGRGKKAGDVIAENKKGVAFTFFLESEMFKLSHSHHLTFTQLPLIMNGTKSFLLVFN